MLNIKMIAINKIRSTVRKTDVVYTFGLDMLFLGWISKQLSFRKNVQLVYEVGNIREILIGKTPINNLARFFEKFLLRYVYVLVITSKAFYTEYFKKVQNTKSLRYHVVENKLDTDIMSVARSQEIAGKELPLPLGGMAIRRSLPLNKAIDYETTLTKAVQVARDHKDRLSKMLIERDLVRIDAPTLDKYLELYANDESITLSDIQYKAIDKLFELGYKHGFYDSPVNVEDFMIPTEYEEIRNS